MIPHINFPTFLTLTRLIISPLVLPFFFVYVLPYNYVLLNGLLALFFLALSLTDLFDGYLARKFSQETVLGTMLDPIADKFLLYATLVALLAAGKLYFYWVIILIGREFFVMGLRAIALEHSFAIGVSQAGKLKTVIYTAFLTVVIANPYQAQGLSGAPLYNGVQTILLVLSLMLSLLSAKYYYDVFMREYMRRHHQ